VADGLTSLKTRFAELHDLEALTLLLDWDLRTIMPPGGTAHRIRHLALLQRIAHEKLIDPEVGRLLDELSPLEDSLDPESDDAGLLRLGRREYEKAVLVPTELRAELVSSAAAAAPVWLEAKATSNFQLFLPELERQLDLKRRYLECFPARDEPYDILLDDFEPDMETDEVRRIFDELKPELLELTAGRQALDVDDSFLTGDFPVAIQEELSAEIVELFGTRPGTWRVDPTEHPFAAGAGIDDIRITTHYYPDNPDSLFSTMHEYGHGIYEHQVPRSISTLPIGTGASLGLHESQSRLWENLVGRSLPFWRFFYPRVQRAFPGQLGDISLERFYAGVNKVQPSLIRIRADEVTYGLHVIMRFELEQELIAGRLDARDLPEAWNQKIWDYLGIEVPDDGDGVLQDMHWSAGLIGYFPTYLLGTVMSVQIWEAAAADIGDLDDRLERGDFATLRGWLGDHVHALGRKYTPQETLRRATGSTIDTRPYLEYLRRKYEAPVAA
jgi:carboxypeptidase Taq